MSCSFELEGERVAKKRRVARVTTGCLDCRRRRVKCPEGSTSTGGRKQPCLRCLQAEVACYYPRQNGGPHEWAKAGSSDESDILYDLGRASGERSGKTPKIKSEGDDEWDWKSLINTDNFDYSNPFESSPSAGSSSSVSDHLTPSIVPPPNPEWLSLTSGPPSNTANGSATLSAISNAWTDPAAFDALLMSIINPDPPEAVSVLCQLSSKLDVQAAIASFEADGHRRLLSTNTHLTQWTQNHMLPYLRQRTLGANTLKGISKLSFDLLKDSFIYLCVTSSSVGSQQSDNSQTRISSARCSTFRLPAHFSVRKLRSACQFSAMITIDCLLGVMLLSLADIANGQAVDRQLLADLSTCTSGLATSSDPMIGNICFWLQSFQLVVATHTASPDCSSSLEFAFRREHEECPVEDSAFGLPPSQLYLMREAHDLFMARTLLQRDTSDQQAVLAHVAFQQNGDKLLKTICERLNASAFLSDYKTIGASETQIRDIHHCALQMLVLREVLAVSGSDTRFQQAQTRILTQMPALLRESPPSLHWSLMIAAVYASDDAIRSQLASVLDAQEMVRHRPLRSKRVVKGLLEECWAEIDAQEGERGGMAPWREYLDAAGIIVWF